jgi:DNA-3-methyladenine glycosylase
VPPHAGAVLPREFFAGHSLEVAPRLLGCVLEHETDAGLVAVRLTEVEAYEGALDPASHSYRGRTARNGVMFGGPGYSYVYFTYGMHWCVNIVCLPPGTASAVLIRAGQVVAGVPLAVSRRSAGRARPSALAERELARGPARLCQALGIDRAQDGLDVCSAESALRIRAGAAGGGPVDISQGPRVGISKAADWPWRFWVTGDPTVSVYRPAVPRARPGRPAQPAGPPEPAQPKAVSPSAGEDGTINR